MKALLVAIALVVLTVVGLTTPVQIIPPPGTIDPDPACTGDLVPLLIASDFFEITEEDPLQTVPSGEAWMLTGLTKGPESTSQVLTFFRDGSEWIDMEADFNVGLHVNVAPGLIVDAGQTIELGCVSVGGTCGNPQVHWVSTWRKIQP